MTEAKPWSLSRRRRLGRFANQPQAPQSLWAGPAPNNTRKLKDSSRLWRGQRRQATVAEAEGNAEGFPGTIPRA